MTKRKYVRVFNARNPPASGSKSFFDVKSMAQTMKLSTFLNKNKVKETGSRKKSNWVWSK